MLHNTGQYGPSDVPINETNMNGRINGLDKMPQNPPMNYNLPDYNPYINMNQFHNYHPVGFSPTLQNWQNNLPMNLNMHQLNYNYGKQEEYKDQCLKNMLNGPQVHTKAFHKQLGMDMDGYHLNSNYRNYTNYNPDLTSKPVKPPEECLNPPRLDERIYNSQYLEQNYDLSRHKMPNYSKPVYQNSEISITANNLNDVHNNFSHDLSMKSQKEKPIIYPENINIVKPIENLSFVGAELDLSKSQKPETPYHYNSDYNSRFYKDEDSRRRSLENTVKMIENILSHSSNTRKIDNNEERNQVQNSNENKSKEPEELLKDNKMTEENKLDNSSTVGCKNEENKCVTNSFNIENEDNDKPVISQNEAVEENYNSNSENQDSSDVSEEDIKPDLEEAVEIKVEVLPSNVDMDHLNPFHRDIFGVSQEDIGDNDIVDSEKSITLAKEVVKNKIQVSGAFFECPHCTLYFSDPKRFLIHTKWHTFGLTNEKRLEMQKEKEMQRYMKKEARVMEKMHRHEVTDVNTPGKKFGCKECDKVFSMKASLKHHKQRYHPKNVSRNCKICGKVLPNWIAFKDHLATHTSDALYQCDDCPKRFKHPHSLAKHRDTHLEKTHGCQQCPKMFGSAALLNVHMKTHERLLRGATFRCTYCGKGFFESYSLQVHERTHRNEKPFTCDICNTSFGTNSSLKRHLKVSHSTSKPFECTTCHRNFMSEAIRDRHMLRSHGNPEDFKFLCKQCPSKYLKLKDLRKHTYKVHPKGKRKKKDDSDSE